MEAKSIGALAAILVVVIFAGYIIAGGITGIALPFYIGWEIGDYVQNALEFGHIAGVGTKTLGAVGLTTATVRKKSISLGVIGGIVMSGITDITTSIGGKLAHNTTRKIRKSLINKISEK